jgi:Domain of unknown function (DUF2017)
VASMRDSVVRLRDGTIALRLVERERTILRAMLGDLRDIVGTEPDPPGLSAFDPGDDADADPAGATDPAPDDAEPAASGPPAVNAEPAASGPPAVDADPVRTRLYPDARPDDPAWSARFRDMIRGDLDDARRANLAVVTETLDAGSIDDSQADAWLHVLNDLRLVMGTRLDITEEDEAEPFDPEDPQAAARIVYAYAGWLEGQFVDVLAAALPDVPEPDVPEPDGAPGDDS